MVVEGDPSKKHLGDSSGSGNASTDMNDPLYLHFNDTNGTPLINIKLTGTENYKVWAAALKHCIHFKNKLGFINGKLVKTGPTDEPFLAEQCQNVVSSGSVNNSDAGTSTGVSLTFTSEQYQRLMSLLCGPGSSSDAQNNVAVNLHEMASASPICLMARASSTKSWLWHQHLSHLNFDTINDLARNDLVVSLPKFKYHKEHLCPSCEQGKSKRASHPPKPVPNLRQRLHLLHMDLCGPMRIASINGKRYILVIVDDYSRYTWVHFLRSKDEAPKVIIKFLKRITVLFQSPIIIIRTDHGTKFKNQVLKVYFESVGISHQMSSVRTPQQNGIVERQNWTLVEVARTMLIFSRAPLFLWAEPEWSRYVTIVHQTKDLHIADYTQLYDFLKYNQKENDREDIGKLGAKGDIGFFIGYSADSCAYRVYNRRSKKIMETMNVSFDELSAMAFKQRSSKPGLQCMTSGQISSRLDLTYAPSIITKQQPTEGKLDLLFESIYDDYLGGQPPATVETVPPVQEPQVRQTSTASTTIADNVPIPTNSSSHATNILITSQDVDELNPNSMVDSNTFVNLFAISSTSAAQASSSSQNKIMETMNVSFDELSAMAFKQRSSKPGLQCMTSRQISSGLDLTYAPSTITMQQPTEVDLDLLFEAMYDDYFGGQPSANVENVLTVQEPQVRQTSTASTSSADNVPIPTNSSSHATNIPIPSQDVDELNPNAMLDGNTFVNLFANPSTSAAVASSSS
nr:hypothetical protein [Tanacetum cinerariifolium]